MSSTPAVPRLAKIVLQLLLLVIPLAWGYLVREPYAISSINILSLLFIGLIGLGLLTKQLRLAWPTDRYFTLTVVLFVAALLYAGFFTDPLRNAVGLWVSRLFQPLLVGYGAYLLYHQRTLSLNNILWPILLSLVALIIQGLGQQLGWLPYHDPGRITANYIYPNTFARYVAFVLILTLPWLTTLSRQQRLVGGALWLGGLLLIFGSLSFGVTIALFAALVVVLIVWPKNLLPKKRLLLGLLIGSFLVIGALYRSTPKWQTSFTDSLTTRQEFWLVGRGIIRDHFWTGIGLKSWEQNYFQWVEKYDIYPPHLNWGSAQPHNVYLDSFIKAGLPGFIGIIGFLIWPVVDGYRQRRSKEWWFGLAGLGLGVVMLVFGLADDPIWSDDVMPLIAVIYFCLAASRERELTK